MKSAPAAFWNNFLSGPQSAAGFKFRAILETLLFLVLCLLTNYLFFRDDMGFLNAALHPFWIIIILVPVRYGLKEGLVSALCVGICYYLFMVVRVTGFNLTYPLLFLLVAGVLGQNRDMLDRKNDRLLSRQQIMSERLKEYEKKETAYRDTLSHFEQSIAAQFSNAMDMFKELSASKEMTSEEMKRYLLEIVKKFLAAEKCTYFEMKDNRCYKVYDVMQTERVADNDAVHIIEEDLILLQAFRTGKMAYLQLSSEQDLKQYDKYKCLIAGCLVNQEGEIRGLVGIESLPFASFNAQSFKLFSSLLEFWSGAINDKLVLEKTREKNIIDETYHIYKYNYFSRRITQEFNRAREFAIPLSVTLLCLKDFLSIPDEKKRDVMAFTLNHIKKFIMDLDMVCHYREAGMIAVIHPFYLYTDAVKQIQALVKEIESYKLTPYRDNEKPLLLVYAGNDFQVGMESCPDFIAGIEKELNKQINS